LEQPFFDALALNTLVTPYGALELSSKNKVPERLENLVEFA
jgi:hypothetical protein